MSFLVDLVKALNWEGGQNFPGKKRTSSCYPQTVVLEENARLQRVIIDAVSSIIMI
jgi:hypothetical protein